MEYEPLQCSAALILFFVAFTAAGARFIPVLLVVELYSACVVVTSMVSGYPSVCVSAAAVAATTAAPFGAV